VKMKKKKKKKKRKKEEEEEEEEKKRNKCVYWLPLYAYIQQDLGTWGQGPFEGGMSVMGLQPDEKISKLELGFCF